MGAAGTVLWLIVVLLNTAAAFGADSPDQVRFTVQGFAVSGQNPLSERQTQAVLAPFLGEHSGLTGLEAATKALEEAFQQKGWAFHQVVVPPQKIEDGVVALQVVASSLDRVVVEDNRHFSEDNIRASLPPLQSGTALNSQETARALRLANEHPAKQVGATLRPGEKPGTFDAAVKVADSRPAKAFVTCANTGDAETGRTRVGVGLQHSNLFNRDHTVTLSYATSLEHADDVSQMGFFYRIPIYPLASGVSFFYTRSDVDQGTVADFFDVSGKGRFSGISVDHALLPIGFYTHKLVADVQDRRFENDIFFAGIPIGTDVRSRPLGLLYEGRYERAWGNAGFSAQFLRNLGGGNDNDDIAYDRVRQGAQQGWAAWRYGADAELRLPARFALRVRLSGQSAGEPLIPGEQFGLGGQRSVRGFEERVVSGESGQHVSTEVWLPPFHPNIGLLTFLDLGWLQRRDPLPVGTFANEHLSSCGLGLRWQWRNRWGNDLALHLDAAYVLNDAAGQDSGDGKIHYYFFYRF